MENNGRLLSLDALRSFDMLFIMGLSAAVSYLYASFGAGDCWLAHQMRHVNWHGFAQHEVARDRPFVMA